MKDRDSEPSASESASVYTLRIDGILDPIWSEWFDGMSVSHGDDGTTVVSGPVVDQAALHRVIRKLRDLGVTLISIQRSEE
jgi:hypothetical protein